MRAGIKAIAVPDFAGATKYAEHGISFLEDDCWETQYDLSIHLYETAALSHFSSQEGDRETLMQRINSVFEHSRDFGDQFKTCCIWIKVLATTDLAAAINASLNVLEWLQEPLHVEDVDIMKVFGELVRCKTKYAGEKKERFLSATRMADPNKMRAMKVMSSLLFYYHGTKPFLAAYVSCRMIEMSMEHGPCEDTVFAASAFASSIVHTFGDTDEGTTWGRVTLSLMDMYNRDALIPQIHGALYGMVFVLKGKNVVSVLLPSFLGVTNLNISPDFSLKEPIQSTLEPLAEGIRLSFASGNVEWAAANTNYYLIRCLHAGTNVKSMTGELEALAHQISNYASTDKQAFNQNVQFNLCALHNMLQELQGGDDQPPIERRALFPLDVIQFHNNDAVLKAALESKHIMALFLTTLYQAMKCFMLRDLDGALKYTNFYMEHLEASCVVHISVSILNSAVLMNAIQLRTGQRQTNEAIPPRVLRIANRF